MRFSHPLMKGFSNDLAILNQHTPHPGVGGRGKQPMSGQTQGPFHEMFIRWLFLGWALVLHWVVKDNGVFNLTGILTPAEFLRWILSTTLQRIKTMNPVHYRPIIASALLEDIQSGDLTSEAIFPAEQLCSAKLIAKQAGVVAGIEVFKETFMLFDSSVSVELHFNDGESCQDRDVIAHIKGPVLSVLGAERVALNLLQRMSGIATLTRQFVQLAEAKCKILDTRKTAPNLRVLDKWAVVLGGGVNHRHGLYDMAMLKENHIKAAGGITQAVEKLLDYDNHQRPIEVEVTNLDELREALTCPVDRIMLDNMDNETMREAVKITADKIDLEASGNVSLETIKGISQTGVDYVSIGALTHSVKAMDYSLLVL